MFMSSESPYRQLLWSPVVLVVVYHGVHGFYLYFLSGDVFTPSLSIMDDFQVVISLIWLLGGLPHWGYHLFNISQDIDVVLSRKISYNNSLVGAYSTSGFSVSVLEPSSPTGW